MYKYGITTQNTPSNREDSMVNRFQDVKLKTYSSKHQNQKNFSYSVPVDPEDGAARGYSSSMYSLGTGHAENLSNMDFEYFQAEIDKYKDL